MGTIHMVLENTDKYTYRFMLNQYSPGHYMHGGHQRKNVDQKTYQYTLEYTIVM
jgi:hypothetical protein